MDAWLAEIRKDFWTRIDAFYEGTLQEDGEPIGLALFDPQVPIPADWLAERTGFSKEEILFASDASNAIIAVMPTLTIRQLDQKTKTRLRVRAAHHGRSMEEEAREILRSVLTASSPTKGNLAEAIRRRFASFGGIEISLPRRDAVRKAPGFEE